MAVLRSARSLAGPCQKEDLDSYETHPVRPCDSLAGCFWAAEQSSVCFSVRSDRCGGGGASASNVKIRRSGTLHSAAQQPARDLSQRDSLCSVHSASMHQQTPQALEKPPNPKTLNLRATSAEELRLKPRQPESPRPPGQSYATRGCRRNSDPLQLSK